MKFHTLVLEEIKMLKRNREPRTFLYIQKASTCATNGLKAVSLCVTEVSVYVKRPGLSFGYFFRDGGNISINRRLYC